MLAARRTVLGARGASAIRRAAPAALTVARLVHAPALRLPLLAGAGAVAGCCCATVALAAAAAASPGYTMAPSGLQISDQQIGEGDPPSVGETVRVHYTGRLLVLRDTHECCHVQTRPVSSCGGSLLY